jgi:hypothetical protein
MVGKSELRCGVLFGVEGTELPKPSPLLRWAGRMLPPLSSERPLLIDGSCIEPWGVLAGVLAGVGGTLPLDPAGVGQNLKMSLAHMPNEPWPEDLSQFARVKNQASLNQVHKLWTLQSEDSALSGRGNVPFIISTLPPPSAACQCFFPTCHH